MLVHACHGHVIVVSGLWLFCLFARIYSTSFNVAVFRQENVACWWKMLRLEISFANCRKRRTPANCSVEYIRAVASCFYRIVTWSTLIIVTWVVHRASNAVRPSKDITLRLVGEDRKTRPLRVQVRTAETTSRRDAVVMAGDSDRTLFCKQP